jgi:hypothetical protein
MEYDSDLVNKSAKLFHDLKFMWVEKFKCNMFSNITYHITHLSNTSHIIFIDNGRWSNELNTT